uniref:ATP synthase F0 subunit 8 n=1 Tax=Mimachlamys varia TaxID=50417 RepID=UPI001FA7E438|nr:ATP synthase F0 subunit 8 [Mimachlamys varia]UNA71547.1 ATP synthase F0 subunit 8 [Mimachlamys varia]
MPQLEPVGWLFWLFVCVAYGYCFFCVLWYVHFPVTKIKFPEMKGPKPPRLPW